MNKQLRTFKDAIRLDRVCQVERLINHYAIRVMSEGAVKVVYLREEEAERLADFLLEQRRAQSAPKLLIAVGDVPSKRTFQHVMSEEYATECAMQLVEDNPSSPIWLAQIIKQYLPKTPVYEWKSI